MATTPFVLEDYRRWEARFKATTRYQLIGPEPMDLEFLPGGKYAKLKKDFRVPVPGMGLIILPAGFIFDGASVPWPFRMTLARYDAWTEPAGVHDWLCRHASNVTRKQADNAFLALLKRANVISIQRFRLYCGVRIGAHLPWIKTGLPKLLTAMALMVGSMGCEQTQLRCGPTGPYLQGYVLLGNTTAYSKEVQPDGTVREMLITQDKDGLYNLLSNGLDKAQLNTMP